MFIYTVNVERKIVSKLGFEPDLQLYTLSHLKHTYHLRNKPLSHSYFNPRHSECIQVFTILNERNSLVLHSERLGLKYEWERGLLLSWYMCLKQLNSRAPVSKAGNLRFNSHLDTNFSLNIYHRNFVIYSVFYLTLS